MKEKSCTQVHLDKVTYTRGLDVSKARMRTDALSCNEKRVYVGNLWFWTMVSRQKG